MDRAHIQYDFLLKRGSYKYQFVSNELVLTPYLSRLFLDLCNESLIPILSYMSQPNRSSILRVDVDLHIFSSIYWNCIWSSHLIILMGMVLNLLRIGQEKLSTSRTGRLFRVGNTLWRCRVHHSNSTEPYTNCMRVYHLNAAWLSEYLFVFCILE